MSRFAIKSSNIVAPDGVFDGYLVVKDDRIAELIPFEAGADQVAGLRVEDVGDHTVMPGLVDTHVHVNEPGRADWEGFETATKAAAAGGITTIVDMPLNSSPVTTSAAALEAKLDAARGKLHVDCGFHGGIIPGSLPDLPGLLDAGVLGVKVFMIDSGLDDFPATDREELTRAAKMMAGTGVPLLAHAERSNNAVIPAEPARLSPHAVTNYAVYAATRPATWELTAIQELIEISEQTGCRIHIVHLATAEALQMLLVARQRDIPITVETCPHYLYFDCDSIAEGSTVHKCAPPIRDAGNRRQLWEALVRGEIDLVASDHSPCPASMKLDCRPNLTEAWGGIAALELTASVILTLALETERSPVDVARWMGLHPATLVGLDDRKGSIEVGKDADLGIWDLDKRFTVDQRNLQQRHKLTAYAGCELVGRPRTVYVGGRVVFDSGRFDSRAPGRILRRSEQ